MTMPNRDTNAPNLPRLALTREEAAASTGLSVRTIDSLLADGRSGFPFFKLGNRVLIPTLELQQWLSDRVDANGK